MGDPPLRAYLPLKRTLKPEVVDDQDINTVEEEENLVIQVYRLSLFLFLFSWLNWNIIFCL